MNKWMITVASWEYRFLGGFQKSVDKFQPDSVLLYFYREYATWSAPNRSKVLSLCNKKGIKLEQYELSFTDHPGSWRVLFNTIAGLQFNEQRVLVDITTMPRETIWTIFDLLESRSIKVQYVYNEPSKYNNKWLTRDPGEPRLVYKLSGEVKMGMPTKILILTGYDVDRIRHLIQFFEPQCVFLGLQTGDQLSNQLMNVKKTKEAFSREQNYKWFDVNAYENDRGFKTIKKELSQHLKGSNIVLSSLGPKLSAIALYNLHKLYPQTCLTYTPSNEFNRRYSSGLGRSHEGFL